MPGKPPPGYEAQNFQKRDRRPKTEDPFTLTSGDNGFQSRTANVFASLGMLEEKHSAVAKVQSQNKSDEERESLQKPDPADNPNDPRPRTDRFRRPHTSRRSRYTPDHRKNPGKWTSYDLSDVSRDQLSEKSNSAAAFQFLQERRNLKRDGEEEEPADLSTKVQFARPASKTSDPSPSASTSSSSDDHDSSKTKFQGKTRVMPEYVIGKGSSNSQQRKAKVRPVGSASAIKLGYLEEEDDDPVAFSLIKSGDKKRKATNSSEDESISQSDMTIQGDKEPVSPIGETVESLKVQEKSEPGFKFRKVSSKKGIRRRRDDDEADNND